MASHAHNHHQPHPQSLQRSNYVLGKGGCAKVYLGRIVDRATVPSSTSASAAPSAAQSDHELTPEGPRRGGLGPSFQAARAALDAISPGMSSVTSSEMHHHAGGDHAPQGTAATCQLVAVKKKYSNGSRQTWQSPSPKPTFGPATLEPEHELMERIPAHPNVMRVLACCTVNSVVHFAMPLMDSDIGHELEKRGAFPEVEALALVRDLLRALAHVHAQGIAHRDVKPSNVLLARDAASAFGVRAVLSDFGVAHLTDAESARHASKGCGTVWYQPPEQLQSIFDTRDAPRCDVWAVGCILYELLVGKVAFKGDKEDSAGGLGTLHRIHDRVGRWDPQADPAMAASHAAPPLFANLPEGTSDATRTLLQHLLQVDPAARITASDALEADAFRIVPAPRDGDDSDDDNGNHAAHHIQLHGYSAPPPVDTLRFEELTEVALDFSDLTCGASTCHRSEQRSRVALGGGLFDDSDGSMMSSVRTLEDRKALAGPAAGPIADGRKVTLGNADANAQFHAMRRCGHPAAAGYPSPATSSTYARPSDGVTSTNSGRRGMPRPASTHSLRSDFSPIVAHRSPRRPLCFDSDDDAPIDFARPRDPLEETARPLAV